MKSPTKVVLLVGKYIDKVYGTANNAFAITDSGDIYVWGYSYRYDKKFNPIPTLIQGISNVNYLITGANHYFIILKTGEIYCWGDNEKGQLGSGHAKNVLNLLPFSLNGDTDIKIYAGKFSTFAINVKGEAYGWGQNSGGMLALNHLQNVYSPEKIIFLSNKKILSLSIGCCHTLALIRIF